MDLLVGSGAGIISILLGVIGVVVSLHPPVSPRARRGVVAIFSGLSLIAIVLTLADRRMTDTKERATNERMQQLKTSSDTLLAQNRELLDSNATLQYQLKELRDKAGPLDVALLQTLKREINDHLKAWRDFQAERYAEFQADGVNSPEADRQRLASDYANRFYPKTRRLLERGAALKQIPRESWDIDGRFIAAGLIPYMDDLQNLAARLPD